jgi:hypothetical protein
MSDALGALTSGLEGRYRIDRELGRGGMATVYLAEDLKHRRSVAVKVILPELVSAIGLVRFLQEIEIAAGLRHPNILPLLDSGEAGGLPYYVMPLVEGDSLRDRLNREKQLPLGDALRITREVGDALAYAHGRGVIHRDITPSNIMLDSGHAVVTDFGIALAPSSTSDRLTAHGVSPGSPQYMSPEQAAGEDVDARTDIYSLGCVLYEMLAGEPPFTGPGPQAILAKKLMAATPSLRVVRDSVPEHVEAAVTTALEKAPADRFPTVERLAEALEGDGPEGRSAEEGPLTALARRPGGLLGIVAAVVAGVGALLTAIGYVSTRVHDINLLIPVELRPSRTDFPVVGVQALVPAFIFCFVGVVVYVGLRFVWRGTALGLNRVPRVEKTLRSLQHRSTSAWQRLLRPVDATTLADAYFISGVVVAVVVLSLFRNLLADITGPESEMFSCSFRGVQYGYYMTMSLLTAGLALGWIKFFRYMRRRRALRGRAALAMWGGLAWVIIIAIVTTMPWRLLWDNDHPRALLEGERAYILMEMETELLIYRPQTRSTERIGEREARQLERLGTMGYLFEDSVAFQGELRGC